MPGTSDSLGDCSACGDAGGHKRQRLWLPLGADADVEGTREKLASRQLLSLALASPPEGEQEQRMRAKEEMREASGAVELSLSLPCSGGVEKERGQGEGEEEEEEEPQLTRTACKPRVRCGEQSPDPVSAGTPPPAVDTHDAAQAEKSGSPEFLKKDSAECDKDEEQQAQSPDATVPTGNARKRKARLEHLVLFWIQGQMQARAKQATQGCANGGSPSVSPVSGGSNQGEPLPPLILEGVSTPLSPREPEQNRSPPRGFTPLPREENRRRSSPPTVGTSVPEEESRRKASPPTAPKGDCPRVEQTPSNETSEEGASSPKSRTSLPNGLWKGMARPPLPPSAFPSPPLHRSTATQAHSAPHVSAAAHLLAEQHLKESLDMRGQCLGKHSSMPVVQPKPSPRPLMPKPPTRWVSFKDEQGGSLVKREAHSDLFFLEQPQEGVGRTQPVGSEGEAAESEAVHASGKSRSSVEKKRRERISASFADLKDAVNIHGDMAHVLAAAANVIREQQKRLEEMQEKLLVHEVRQGLYKKGGPSSTLAP